MAVNLEGLRQRRWWSRIFRFQAHWCWEFHRHPVPDLGRPFPVLGHPILVLGHPFPVLGCPLLCHCQRRCQRQIDRNPRRRLRREGWLSSWNCYRVPASADPRPSPARRAAVFDLESQALLVGCLAVAQAAVRAVAQSGARVMAQVAARAMEQVAARAVEQVAARATAQAVARAMARVEARAMARVEARAMEQAVARLMEQVKADCREKLRLLPVVNRIQEHPGQHRVNYRCHRQKGRDTELWKLDLAQSDLVKQRCRQELTERRRCCRTTSRNGRTASDCGRITDNRRWDGDVGWSCRAAKIAKDQIAHGLFWLPKEQNQHGQQRQNRRRDEDVAASDPRPEGRDGRNISGLAHRLRGNRGSGCGFAASGASDRPPVRPRFGFKCLSTVNTNLFHGMNSS